jgi:DNA modification methylase
MSSKPQPRPKRKRATVGKPLVRDKTSSLAPRLFFKTKLGREYLGDSLQLLRALPDDSVNLVVTSPPYALHFKKEYGNASQSEYVDWMLPFAKEIHRVLAQDGSFVLNIGGAWTPGQPTRSIYHYELLLALVKQARFCLAQEFFWWNPAKLPAPAEWVTVRKIRVKDATEHVWWLSKTPFPKADNRRVLQPYSPDMHRLIKRGYRPKQRPSGHVITAKFGHDHGGSIPPNYFLMGNNDANSHYFRRCIQDGRKPHPARFPSLLPEFFIKMLTDEMDTVIDPFAGSNTTGAVCEVLRRRWVAVESSEEYLKTAAYRFEPEGLAGLRERLAGSGTQLPAVEAPSTEDLPLFQKTK